MNTKEEIYKDAILKIAEYSSDGVESRTLIQIAQRALSEDFELPKGTPTREELITDLDDKRVVKQGVSEDAWHFCRKQTAEYLLEKYYIKIRPHTRYTILTSSNFFIGSDS